MSTILQKYPVQSGDRVQELSARFLNDTTRWLDIVSLNNLRRPYISDNILDQFGPILGTFPLQQSLLAGATEITNWDTVVTVTGRSFNSSSLLVPGAILVFVYQGTDITNLGDVQYDIVQITTITQGVNYSNGHTTLGIKLQAITSYRSMTKKLVTNERGLVRAHAVGEIFQVYGSPLQLTTAVARTGDTISLPLVFSDNDFRVNSIKDIVNSLGVDIFLDPGTGQKKAGPNGDLATVSGAENVKQALRIRAETEPGELILHPDYGNNLKFYIGFTQNTGWPNLALTLLHDCLLQDPRVDDVLNLHYRQVNDASFIDATVRINETGQVFTNTVRIT